MSLGERLRRLKPVAPKTKAVVAAEKAVVKAAIRWFELNQTYTGMSAAIEGDRILRVAVGDMLVARAKAKKAKGSP